MEHTEFVAHLKKMLDKERAQIEQGLGRGSAGDWGAYQKQVGVVAGLGLVEREVVKLVDAINKREES